MWPDDQFFWMEFAYLARSERRRFSFDEFAAAFARAGWDRDLLVMRLRSMARGDLVTLENAPEDAPEDALKGAWPDVVTITDEGRRAVAEDPSVRFMDWVWTHGRARNVAVRPSGLAKDPLRDASW